MHPEKKKNVRMWTLYALLFLAVLLVQNVIFSRFFVADVHFFLIPLVTCCVSVCTGAEPGGIFSLLAGLAWALSGGSDGGIMIVGLTVCGLLSGYLCDAVLTRRLFPAVVLCIMSLAVTLGGALLVRMYLQDVGLWGLQLCLRQILISAPLAPVFYGLAKCIRKAGP